MWVGTFVLAHVWKSGNTFVELVPFLLLYMASGGRSQVARLVQQVPLPTTHTQAFWNINLTFKEVVIAFLERLKLITCSLFPNESQNLFSISFSQGIDFLGIFPSVWKLEKRNLKKNYTKRTFKSWVWWRVHVILVHKRLTYECRGEFTTSLNYFVFN